MITEIRISSSWELMIAQAMGSWLVRVSGGGRWFGLKKVPVRWLSAL
jgi:hypothetical protein